MWEKRGLDLFEKDREYIVFYGVFSIFFGGRLGLDLFRKDRESEKIGVSIFSEKIENLKNRGLDLFRKDREPFPCSGEPLRQDGRQRLKPTGVSQPRHRALDVFATNARRRDACDEGRQHLDATWDGTEVPL